MSLHRRAAKRDASEAAIVEMLEACGWRVLRVSVKDGPDLFASKPSRTVLNQHGQFFIMPERCVAIEVKTGSGKLKPGQKRWLDDWPGETAVIRDIEQVREL
jgi:hypothetical protein